MESSVTIRPWYAKAYGERPFCVGERIGEFTQTVRTETRRNNLGKERYYRVRKPELFRLPFFIGTQTLPTSKRGYLLELHFQKPFQYIRSQLSL
jgi:hypothetical protein